jgi:hypothetical protein
MIGCGRDRRCRKAKEPLFPLGVDDAFFVGPAFPHALVDLLMLLLQRAAALALDTDRNRNRPLLQKNARLIVVTAGQYHRVGAAGVAQREAIFHASVIACSESRKSRLKPATCGRQGHLIC